MDKISLVKKYDIPHTIFNITFIMSIIFFLAPYLPGSDFGIFKIPDFTTNLTYILYFLGPITFMLHLFFLIPLWKAIESVDEKRTVEPIVTPILEVADEKKELITSKDSLDRKIDTKNKRIEYVKSISRDDFIDNIQIVVTTETGSHYKITKSVQDDEYVISGGYFDKNGPSPIKLKIHGCIEYDEDEIAFQNHDIYPDYIAAVNLSIAFSNGVNTTPIKRIMKKYIE